MTSQLHFALFGQTGTGKTFAAQQFARFMRARGLGVLALHKPLEAWPADAVSWQTPDPEAYLWKWERSRRCGCFMELADAFVDKWDARFHRCFSSGRHLGHRCFYITQRAALVHPNIRDNCSSLCLFAVPTNAARLWAMDFNDENLLRAVNLPPRYFFFKPSRYDSARLMTLAP